MVAVIDVPIYTKSVAVLAEITLEEFDRFYYDNATKVTDEEYRKIRKDIQDTKDVGGVVWWLDSGLALMYVRDGKSDYTVPHEIFHVCNKILYTAGVTHDGDAEPWAYLIGWFTNEYYKLYWEWADNGKKKYA
jgi:hypothetical protein